MLLSNLYKVILFIAILSACNSTDSDKEIPNSMLEITVNEVTNLDDLIKETSGLIYFDTHLITHNDSGDEPNLYEVNRANGAVIRTIFVENASNRDMEDIAQDENYIYLCDIGNNTNTRKDQTIYKIKKTDYLTKDLVLAELITFSYKEQTDFDYSNQSTNFDAEAVVSIGSNLYLFTKNWGDLKTSVYAIPKNAGNYEISSLAIADVKGLITGADYDKNTDRIVLTGYANFKAFVVVLSDFTNNPLDGKIQKIDLDIVGSKQVEGVSYNPDGFYFLSAEESAGLPAVLYKMSLN